MSLPYPGKYESHGSWMRRCDEYDRDQARWRREQASRASNWGGYNYRPIARDVQYQFPDGKKVQAVKVGYGPRNAQRVAKFAREHGLSCVVHTIGCGMTARTDGVVFRDEKLDAVYSNDNH